MKFSSFLGVTLITFSLSAQVQKVDISNIQLEFGKILEKESEGALKLISFEKMNSVMGFNEYHRSLEYQAEVEVKKECFKVVNAHCQYVLHVMNNPCPSKYWDKSQQILPGTKFKFTGGVKIVLSENGWLLNLSDKKDAGHTPLGVNDCQIIGNQGAQIIKCQNGRPVNYSPTEIVSGKVYTRAEEMPVYPGGDAALLQDISARTTYPKQAQNKRIEGKVYVSYIVDEEGNIVNAKIVKGAHPLLNEEALRVINSLPGYQEPGREKGNPVNVQFTIPISFSLNK